MSVLGYVNKQIQVILSTGILLYCLGILIDQQVSKGIGIPCLFKAVFKFPCLGCGLSKSFLAFLNGNIIMAFKYHVLGPLFIIGSCLVLIYNILDKLNMRIEFRSIPNWMKMSITSLLFIATLIQYLIKTGLI